METIGPKTLAAMKKLNDLCEVLRDVRPTIAEVRKEAPEIHVRQVALEVQLQNGEDVLASWRECRVRQKDCQARIDKFYQLLANIREAKAELVDAFSAEHCPSIRSVNTDAY